MIYEIRMTVVFEIRRVVDSSKGIPESVRQRGDYKKVKVTLIDYIEADGVGEAFNKAAEYKHEVIIKLAKGESDMWNRKAWGETSEDISISLDAVVAKPDIEGPLPISIAGHYRSPSGMIPVSRKTLKSNPELIKDKNFFSLESYPYYKSDESQVINRGEALRKIDENLKQIKRISKETGIPVATLILMKRRGYKVVKLVEKV